MEIKTPSGLVAHAKAQLGLPYVYGTFGQVLTQDIINQKRKQYPSQVTAERAVRAKTFIGKRTYDCAGLVKSYWMQQNPTAPPKYSTKYDKSADGLYAACKASGKINSLSERPGTLVFMFDSKNKRMHHVGICAGGGRVFEARGFDYGVVETSLTSRSWTHWGQLDWFDAKGTATTVLQLRVGDRVRVKKGTKEYYPGTSMPSWLPGQEHRIAQVKRNGRDEVRGGKRCVLLAQPINTWCAVDYLEKV